MYTKCTVVQFTDYDNPINISLGVNHWVLNERNYTVTCSSQIIPSQNWTIVKVVQYVRQSCCKWSTNRYYIGVKLPRNRAAGNTGQSFRSTDGYDQKLKELLWVFRAVATFRLVEATRRRHAHALGSKLILSTWLTIPTFPNYSIPPW